MGCAAGRPQQLPLLPGPIPFSLLAATGILTCSMDTQLSCPLSPALPGSGLSVLSHLAWNVSHDLQHPRPQKKKVECSAQL